MNERQAQYICTIASEGSITAAARKLNVSQPSLSQMIRQLESEAGVSLFDRSSLPIQLTYAGRQYVECAKTILAASAKLENQMKNIRMESSGVLRAGISVQRGMKILPLALPEFHAQYPGVDLQIREAGSATLEEYLRTGEIDLMFAAIDSTSPEFDYQLIEKEIIGILAGSGSGLTDVYENGSALSVEDTAYEKYVYLRRGHSVRVVQDQLFRKYALEPQVLLETDSLEVARRVTAATGACMLLPNIYYDEEMIKAGAMFYPLKKYTNRRHFYASKRKNEELPRYAHDLVEIVRETLHQGRQPEE